ncbi:MAG: OmpA/MotB family protein [Phycisphaerales bacterium]
MLSVGKIGRVGMLIAGALLLTTMLGGCNDSLKTENEALKGENVNLRADLATAKQQADTCAIERAQLQAQLDALMAKGGKQSGTDTGDTGFTGDVRRGAHGEIIVRVPGDVLFASGKVDLKSGSKQSLSQIASVIKSKYAGHTIRVEGYTDSDKITKSKWTDNLELSAHRAMAVYRYLKEQGVNGENMYAAGFGANNPVAPNSGAGKSKNRRVEIVVLQ